MPFRPRSSLPARCASLPPIHLECPELVPRPTAVLSTIPEAEDHFPWARLPKEIQHGILRNTLALPDTRGHNAVFGGEQHKTHLLETVVPLFLGLGSWDAYIEAASVLYSHLCITPTANENAVLKLLSSPETLRVRNLIEELDIHIRMPHDLTLFDIGPSDTQNNVPTALHSMRVHGRLRKVDFSFYVPDLQTCHYDHGSTLEYDVLSLYPNLPMARLQVASRGFSTSSRDTPQDDCTAVSRDVQPGSVIIAPAYLASRAFQSGLLPLLERDVFQSSSLTMKLFSTKNDDDIRNANIDGNSMFKYWFGAIKVEDLPEEKRWLLPREKPNDLFPFVPQAGGSCDFRDIQRDEDGDEKMVILPKMHDATVHCKADLRIETAEYRERGDDLLSSPVRCPELQIDSGFALSSRKAVENLHGMFTRTAAEVTDQGDMPGSQEHALPCQKADDFVDSLPSSTCYSDAPSDHFSSCIDAVSSATVPTSDIVEAVDVELTADSLDAPDEKDMPGQEAPAVAEPQPESHVIGEYSLENPESDVTREIIQTEQPLSLSHSVEQVDAKSTKSAVDSMLESDSESESESDHSSSSSSSSSDSDSGSVTDSSEKMVMEHQPQGIVQLAASSSHAPEANGHPLNHETNSDSSDDSAEEFPPSRSAAFVKENPSPHKIPIPTRKTDPNSSDDTDNTDMSSDSSSSEDEGDLRSPTVEVSRHAGQHQQPIGNGSLVMTGALPSSDLSFSSSSESDSEEGKLSSKALSQVSKILEARACPEVGLATIDEEKGMPMSNAKTIPQRSPGSSAKKSEDALSSSFDDSDSDSEASSSSSSDSDMTDSDSDGSSSDSDSSESSSDDSSTEVERPCPKCGKILPVEGVRKNTTTSHRRNKIPAQPESRPVSQTARPVVVSTPPAQLTAANKHQSRYRQKKGLHGSNNVNNTTPRPSNKRKTPPQSTNSTPLSKSQRKRRYWAQRRRQGRAETA